MKSAILVLPLTLLAVASAKAQIANPYTVRLGYSYLLKSDSSDLTKKSGYTVGLGYDFLELKEANVRIGADLDFYTHAGNGNKIEVASLQLVGRKPLNLGVKGVEFYGGLGAGLYRSLVSYDTTSNTGSTVTTTHQSSNVFLGGAQIMFGATYEKSYSLELVYKLVKNNTGVDTNTLGIVAGYHF